MIGVLQVHAVGCMRIMRAVADTRPARIAEGDTGRTAGTERDGTGQSPPSATALLTQGTTSSNIASSDVVAVNPSTSRALATSGTRFCTS
jgi:hypothetical protein